MSHEESWLIWSYTFLRTSNANQEINIYIRHQTYQVTSTQHPPETITEIMRAISLFVVLATSVFAIPSSPAILLNGVMRPPPEPICPRTFPCYGIVSSYSFVHQSDQFDRSRPHVLPGRVSSAATYLRWDICEAIYRYVCIDFLGPTHWCCTGICPEAAWECGWQSCCPCILKLLPRAYIHLSSDFLAFILYILHSTARAWG